MVKRVVLLAAAACALNACGDDERTDFLTVSINTNNLGGQVAVRVQQPSHTTNITHAQLQSVNGVPPQITLNTGKSGVLRVSYVVLNSTQDTISTGSVDLGLHAGYAYGVSGQRERANANDFCFGCTGMAKFPIRDPKNPTTDSLWLFYSAMPPCKGCVY